jgi:hypothetical protein
MRLLLCLFLAASAFAQIDKSTLTAKYGPALNRETFTVRPGIELIANYGPAYQVCSMELPGTLPEAQSDQILDELVPTAMRGTKGPEFMGQSGLASVRSVEYENIIINESYTGAVRNSLIVIFKNAGCPKPDRQ